MLLDEEEETACLSSNLSLKLVFCGATCCQAEGKSSRLTEERVGPGLNGQWKRFHSRNLEVWLSKAKILKKKKTEPPLFSVICMQGGDNAASVYSGASAAEASISSAAQSDNNTVKQ